MKKEKQAGSVSTILGLGSSIEGTIHFQNTMRLDGNVKGKIRGLSGTIIIGEQAVVDADIVVDVAVIMGQVNGDIVARERIEIYPPGRVSGDIQAPTLQIEAGVKFSGSCAMESQKEIAKKEINYTENRLFMAKTEGK